jgi:hypothetical protein
VTLLARILSRSVPELVRLACVLALLALGLVCWSVLQPRPVPVILAMSAGHAVGASAFACYLLAVILDAVQHPPPAEQTPLVGAPAQSVVDSKGHNVSLGSSRSTDQS